MKTPLALALSLAVLANPLRAEIFDCVMDPAVVVSVGTPVTGLLEDVMVRRGQIVQQGEVIARMRSEMEQAQIRLIQKQSENTEEIAMAQVRLDLAIKRQERATELSTRGIATGEQMEEAEAAVGVATRELALARIRRDLSILELERTEVTLDQKTVRSPITGLVVDRPLFRGEFVMQESHVAIIAQLDPLHVEAFLPVSIYPEVAKGQIGLVRPADPIGGTYEATVISVDQVFDPASGTFGVLLALPNSEAKLPAGHRCTLELGHGGG